MESSFGSQKNELAHHHHYALLANSQVLIRKDVDRFYKRGLCRSRVGNALSELFDENFSKQVLSELIA